MQKNAIALIVGIALPLMSHSQGGLVSDFEKYKDTPRIRLYVEGLSQGFLVANADLSLRKLPLLYCQPDRLGLTVDNYIELISARIASGKDYGPTTIDLALLDALKEKFPC